MRWWCHGCSPMWTSAMCQHCTRCCGWHRPPETNTHHRDLSDRSR